MITTTKQKRGMIKIIQSKSLSFQMHEVEVSSLKCELACLKSSGISNSRQHGTISFLGKLGFFFFWYIVQMMVELYSMVQLMSFTPYVYFVRTNILYYTQYISQIYQNGCFPCSNFLICCIIQTNYFFTLFIYLKFYYKYHSIN